jgi:hypothetical protein
MNLKTTLVVIAFAAAGFVANSAMSEEVSPPMKDITIEGHTEDVVKAACDGYFGLTDSRGIYSCVNKDGSGIVCGGITDKEKNSCHTFQLEPDSTILKTILATPRPTESQEVFEPEGNKCCVFIGGDRICRSC